MKKLASIIVISCAGVLAVAATFGAGVAVIAFLVSIVVAAGWMASGYLEG